MAVVELDGYRFDIPDGVPITGNEVIDKVSEVTNIPVKGAPYVRTDDRDQVLEREKPYAPEAGDRIGVVSYFETARERK